MMMSKTEGYHAGHSNRLRGRDIFCHRQGVTSFCTFSFPSMRLFCFSGVVSVNAMRFPARLSGSDEPDLIRKGLSRLKPIVAAWKRGGNQACCMSWVNEKTKADCISSRLNRYIDLFKPTKITAACDRDVSVSKCCYIISINEFIFIES